jgi:hypothetical protein
VVWLKDLPEAERRAVGKDLLRAQWRWPVGMPLCRPMGAGLWDTRIQSSDHRTYRRPLYRLKTFDDKVQGRPSYFLVQK